MIQRPEKFSRGAWQATTYAELASISSPVLGDEAWVTDEGRWYKYSTAWLPLTPGSSRDDVYVLADGSVVSVQYTGPADLS